MSNHHQAASKSESLLPDHQEQFRSTIKEFIDEILQHQSIEHNSDLANRFAEAGFTPMVLAAVPKEDLLHQFSLPGNIATPSQVADIISLQQASLVQKRPPSEFCRSPPPSRVKRKRKCIRKHRLPVGRGRGSVKDIWGLRRRMCSFWQRVAAEEGQDSIPNSVANARQRRPFTASSRRLGNMRLRDQQQGDTNCGNFLNTL